MAPGRACSRRARQLRGCEDLGLDGEPPQCAHRLDAGRPLRSPGTEYKSLTAWEDAQYDADLDPFEIPAFGFVEAGDPSRSGFPCLCCGHLRDHEPALLGQGAGRPLHPRRPRTHPHPASGRRHPRRSLPRRADHHGPRRMDGPGHHDPAREPGARVPRRALVRGCWRGDRRLVDVAARGECRVGGERHVRGHQGSKNCSPSPSSCSPAT